MPRGFYARVRRAIKASFSTLRILNRIFCHGYRISQEFLFPRETWLTLASSSLEKYTCLGLRCYYYAGANAVSFEILKFSFQIAKPFSSFPS